MVAIPYPILERYRWTVDVEGDWGGRSLAYSGLVVGLPLILKEFKKNGIKALFFISTEMLEKDPHYSPLGGDDIKRIIDEGHEIGSHGHAHFIFKDEGRFNADKRKSEKILSQYQKNFGEKMKYRAPKFNRQFQGEIYSCRRSHVSLLRHMWLREKIQGDTIIYLHPFDLCEWNKFNRPPNLFCKLWYSRPKQAYKLFQEMVNNYKW